MPGSRNYIRLLLRLTLEFLHLGHGGLRRRLGPARFRPLNLEVRKTKSNDEEEQQQRHAAEHGQNFDRRGAAFAEQQNQQQHPAADHRDEHERSQNDEPRNSQNPASDDGVPLRR